MLKTECRHFTLLYFACLVLGCCVAKVVGVEELVMWVHGDFLLACIIWSIVWYGVVSQHMNDSPRHPEGTVQRVIDDYPPDSHITQDVYRSYPCLPKHIHIAQANDVDERGQVSFTVSLSLTYGFCDTGRPVIFYGQGLQEIGRIRGTKPVHFNYTSDLSEGIFHSDWIYHMELPNLKAGMHRYWYRIAVEQDNRISHTTAAQRTLRGSHGYYLGETQTIPFYTPPLPHSPTALALVGDLGQTPNSMRTLAGIYESTLLGGKITKEHPHTPITQLLIAGDMSYADTDPWRWLSWMTLVEPLVRSTPLHVAAGNHEIECDTTTRDIFVPFEHYFRNPNRIGPPVTEPVSDAYRKTLWNGSCGSPSAFQGVYNFGNSFYSYRHGLAHIIVLNSYTSTAVGSVQYQWLVEELATRVDRRQTPWLVVAFHAPFYTTFMGHIDEIEATVMRDTMEPLFVQYGVNLVVSGHDHAYMRTHPMQQGNMTDEDHGIVYLTLGAGGNREGHARGFRDPESPEPWVAFRTLQDFGYGHLYLANASHAHFQWIGDSVAGEDGSVDSVWFLNSQNRNV